MGIADPAHSTEVGIYITPGHVEGVAAWSTNDPPGQIHRSTTPSLASHIWHLARWADYMQDMLAGSGAQIWEKERLATQWGFGSVDLGFAATDSTSCTHFLK